MTYIFLIVYAFESIVAPGTVCPGAIYVVFRIYNPTNNVVYIKYRTKKYRTFVVMTTYNHRCVRIYT